MMTLRASTPSGPSGGLAGLKPRTPRAHASPVKEARP